MNERQKKLNWVLMKAEMRGEFGWNAADDDLFLLQIIKVINYSFFNESGDWMI